MIPYAIAVYIGLWLVWWRRSVWERKVYGVRIRWAQGLWWPFHVVLVLTSAVFKRR